MPSVAMAVAAAAAAAAATTTYQTFVLQQVKTTTVKPSFKICFGAVDLNAKWRKILNGEIYH
jgi:hypothetical protein